MTIQLLLSLLFCKYHEKTKYKIMPPYNIDEAIVVPQFIRSSRANTLLIHYLSLSSRSSPQDVSFSISNLYRMCGAHARARAHAHAHTYMYEKKIDTHTHTHTLTHSLTHICMHEKKIYFQSYIVN